jgi:hypothetical protein
MDRALDYGSSGWEFDSLRAHHRGLPASEGPSFVPVRMLGPVSTAVARYFLDFLKKPPTHADEGE